MKDKYIVITTINPKTQAVRAFEKKLAEWNIVLVGDKKSQPIDNFNSTEFLSIENQEALKTVIFNVLPYNHYVRKNIGYLYALMKGATVIYDTDDDNLPYDDWSFPGLDDVEAETISKTKYFNIYQSYCDLNVWPRGFPLSHILGQSDSQTLSSTKNIGAWQGLADLDPDVDAIHRLVFNQEITFDKREPLVLDQGVYCPFNSQNTLWHKDMITYAYLPATVTFRFTDILRGYIAQRCFWAHNRHLGFTQATVYQERNEHNLMQDFESEIPCYIQVEQVVSILDSLELKDDCAYNLRTVYQALAKANIVKESELDIVEAWLTDLNRIQHG